MIQPPIDLLPESLRARSLAAVVAGRYVAAALIGATALLLPATHSRMMLDGARERLEIAETQADLVLAAERKADRLRQRLEDSRLYLERYELLAMPFSVSRLMATIINDLPSSATLDRMDLYVGTKRTRGARSGGVSAAKGPAPRILSGELSGFAASDEDVADIVARLEKLRICDSVSLDFSRTRSIRDTSAREFRISFRIQLDVPYEVVDRSGEVAHVE